MKPVLWLVLLALTPGKRPLVIKCPAAGEQFGWGELPQDLDELEAAYHERPQVIAGDRFRVHIAAAQLDDASWDERLEAVVCRPAKPPALKPRAKPAPLSTAEHAIADEYTVVLRTPAPRTLYSMVEDMGLRYALAIDKLEHLVPAATGSFSGKLSAKQVQQIRSDARVDYVAQDETLSAE